MRSSIIIKIFVSFLLVSLLPIGALIAYNDWMNREIVYNMKVEEIRKQAGKLAKSIDREISLRKERIQCISNNCIKAAIKETLSPSVENYFRTRIRQISASESIFVLNGHGEIIASNTPDIWITNYSNRDFFKEAIKGNTYVSEPVLDQGKGYIYYSTPLKNHKKKIMGVVVMRRQAEELWRLFEEEKDFLGKGSLCILTDGYGVRIAHATDRSLIFKSWVELDPDTKNKLETESHYGEDIKEIGFTHIPEVSKAVSQNGGLYFIHPLIINTENNHGYCIPLKEKHWKLIYTVPASTFLAQVKHLTQNALFSTGIVFIVVIATTWVLSKNLLQPIKRLTYSANEIANGNLDHPITNGSQDEIGKLMNSFEIMRNKLKGSYKELKDANVEAILMLARACEVRDEDTGNHVMRINYYSTALAMEIGLDEDFVRELGPSSILHDVGKIHIPDYLLRKQNHFTDREREEMEKHPLYGYKILGEKHFFKMAREIARWHHENWNGTGYPDKLKSEVIPVSARIVRLADVYDALVMKRPYKNAWTDQEAYDEIVNHSGIYFDPDIIDAFKQLFRKGIMQEIKKKYT